MNAVTHLEKVIVGEVSAVTHLEKVIAGETSAVTYTEKVITGEAPPITHLQKVIAGKASPVTHLEHIWAGGSPTPTEHEYTGVVPYSFNADGSPLISWRISGNMSQTGTPTPDNPIMPQGTGERTGNLLDENISSDADITHINYNKSAPIILTAGQTYTFSCNTTCNGLYIRSAADDSNLASANNSITLTYTPQVNVSAYCRVWNSNGMTNLKPMLNTGSTALPYEPYGYKLDILSASTTTPIYLGEVQTTRKIKKYEFTGQEDWCYDGTSFYINIFSMTEPVIPNSPLYCSHFVNSSQGMKNGTNWAFATKYKTATTASDWKAYLAQQYAAGTPVTVWYVLATEETGIVNEPLMKIGDYADEVSNVATIPTNNGSNTFDVDTTVKPSEVYIKYKGV